MRHSPPRLLPVRRSLAGRAVVFEEPTLGFGRAFLKGHGWSTCRPPRSRQPLGSLLLCAAICLAGHRGAAAETQLRLRPCAEIEDSGALCGFYRAPEDYEKPRGRSTEIPFVLLRAVGRDKVQDPIFFVSGGPGTSAVAVAHRLGSRPPLSQLRLRRDLIFADQRGVSGSTALRCDLVGGRTDAQAFLEPLMPPSAVRRCREQLEPRADLTRFTTLDAAEDLEHIRRALGYERINLFAVSYGTILAQTYASRYGKRVRTMILRGVDHPASLVPLHYPRDAQESLESLFDACLAEDRCRQKFPDLRRDLRAVLDQLEREPLVAGVRHPGTDRPEMVRLSKDRFTEALRYMLYSDRDARQLPRLLHAAAQNDVGPVAQWAVSYRHAAWRGLAAGVFLSVTCSEQIPFIDKEEANRLAAGSFFGIQRYRELTEACAEWPRRLLPRDFHSRRASGIPTVLLSAGIDPATPARWAAEIARLMPNALHVVVPQATHFFDAPAGAGCLHGLIAAFVGSGSTTALDPSCVSEIRRSPFSTEANETDDGTPTQQLTYADHLDKGRHACDAQDFELCRAHLSAAVALAPTNAAAIYYLSRALALGGRSEAALETLERAVALKSYQALAAAGDAAFAPLRDTPRFRAVVANAERSGLRVGHSRVAFVLPEKDLFPEGVAHDRVTGALYISSVYKRKIVRIARSGDVRDFISTGQYGILGVLGMEVDSQRRRLWVCSAPPGPLSGSGSITDRRTGLYSFDVDNGSLVAHVTPPDEGEHFFNDLTLTRGGEVFVTDTAGHSVYRLAAGSQELKALVEPRTLLYPNGITLSKDQNRLFVAHSRGVSALDLRTNRWSLVQHGGDVTLAGIDGLGFYAGALVAHQPLHLNRVMLYRLNPTLNRVVRAETLEAHHPSFDVPTTGEVVGGHYYYVANSQLLDLGPDAAVPPISTLADIVILAVALR